MGRDRLSYEKINEIDQITHFQIFIRNVSHFIDVLPRDVREKIKGDAMQKKLEGYYLDPYRKDYMKIEWQLVRYMGLALQELNLEEDEDVDLEEFGGS